MRKPKIWANFLSRHFIRIQPVKMQRARRTMSSRLTWGIEQDCVLGGKKALTKEYVLGKKHGNHDQQQETHIRTTSRHCHTGVRIAESQLPSILNICKTVGGLGLLPDRWDYRLNDLFRKQFGSPSQTVRSPSTPSSYPRLLFAQNNQKHMSTQVRHTHVFIALSIIPSLQTSQLPMSK